MIVSKIKLTTAVAITTGILGSGIGWVAVRGGGLGTVQAQQAETKGAASPSRRPESARLLEAQHQVAEADVEAAQARLAAAETLLMVAKEELQAQEVLHQKIVSTEAGLRRAYAQFDQAVLGVCEAKAKLAAAMQELERFTAAADGPAPRRESAKAIESNQMVAQATQVRVKAEGALAQERAEKETDRRNRALKVDAAKRDVAKAGLEAAEAKLAAAEQMLVVAKEEFEAQKSLRAKNATSSSDFRRAQVQLNQAVAARGEAQAHLAVARAELVYVETQIAQANSNLADDGAAEKLSAAAERDELISRQNDLERKRTQLTIESRLNVVAAEERLKSLDNEHSTEQQRMLQQTAAARSEIQKQKERRANLTAQLAGDHPQVKALDDEIKRGLDQIELLQQEFKASEDHRLKVRMKAREEAIRAEENFKSLERRLAGEESELLSRRTENQQRLQKARGASPGGSSDQRLADIERKLDALVRELTEMRKVLKK